jgi:hypothetical protein
MSATDQVPSRIVVERGVRAALAAAALVEQHDAVASGVEKPPLLGTGAAARTAVQKHHRLAVGIAGLLEVERVDL